MEIIIHQIEKNKVAEIKSEQILISSLQDALDLIADISYKGINKIILGEKNITNEFYNLSSGLAGEILQKCVNYGINLAIIGDFEKYESKSMKAFILECNRGNQFYFVKNIDEAKHMLVN